jgi:hypothetical protein
MGSFSEAAIQKIKHLIATADTQVGEAYPGNKAGKTQTSCIGFVAQVLAHAYQKVGKGDVAKEVRKMTYKGTDLAKYLTTRRYWRAHYWNPDVVYPVDSDGEHSYSAKVAVRDKLYYKIPLSGKIVDYRLTPNKGKRKATTAALGRFSLVPFAVGITYGGYHTFLCSYGSIYEVHYKQIGSKLYEETPFDEYKSPWLSGIVVVPKETAFKSDPL